MAGVGGLIPLERVLYSSTPGQKTSKQNACRNSGTKNPQSSGCGSAT